MRVTKDTFTGKPFRWNTTVFYLMKDGTEGTWVPARCTSRTFEFLTPDRVPEKLLRELQQAKESDNE